MRIYWICAAVTCLFEVTNFSNATPVISKRFFFEFHESFIIFFIFFLVGFPNNCYFGVNWCKFCQYKLNRLHKFIFNKISTNIGVPLCPDKSLFFLPVFIYASYAFLTRKFFCLYRKMLKLLIINCLFLSILIRSSSRSVFSVFFLNFNKDQQITRQEFK